MKFCSGRPGCTNRVPVGRGAYCEDCRPTQQGAQRGTAVERGYGSRWKAERNAFLREFPLCGQRPGGQAAVMSQCCEQGMVAAAGVVDHVVPHRGDEVLFWDREGNWQSLCRDCHDAKTRAGL